MNNDEIRKDVTENKLPESTADTPEDLIKSISELIEDRFPG